MAVIAGAAAALGRKGEEIARRAYGQIDMKASMNIHTCTHEHTHVPMNTYTHS